MKLLSFILLFVSCSCFALSSEEFDKQYQNLNGELNKAVINNMIYSKDYDDKKIPLSEKIESKSKWCDLTKTRINLLDFVCRLLHLKIISLKKPLQIGLCNKAYNK